MFPDAAAPRDGTYWDALERGRSDVKAHETWRAERMADDVAKIKSVLARGGDRDGDVAAAVPEES
jgi:hypothetical protein